MSGLRPAGFDKRLGGWLDELVGDRAELERRSTWLRPEEIARPPSPEPTPLPAAADADRRAGDGRAAALAWLDENLDELRAIRRTARRGQGVAVSSSGSTFVERLEATRTAEAASGCWHCAPAWRKPNGDARASGTTRSACEANEGALQAVHGRCDDAPRRRCGPWRCSALLPQSRSSSPRTRSSAAPRASRLRRPADLGARPAARQPEVRALLPAALRALLIDEFQDTDPLQAEIACSSRATSRTASDWRELEPRPGSCSWSATPSSRSTASAAPTSDLRRGEARLLAGGLREHRPELPLGPAVIDWVNRVFDQLLRARAGLPARERAAASRRARGRAERPPVVVVRGDRPGWTPRRPRRGGTGRSPRCCMQRGRRALAGAGPRRRRGRGRPRWRRRRDPASRPTGLEAYEDAFAARRRPVPPRRQPRLLPAAGGARPDRFLRAIDDPTDRSASSARCAQRLRLLRRGPRDPPRRPAGSGLPRRRAGDRSAVDGRLRVLR